MKAVIPHLRNQYNVFGIDIKESTDDYSNIVTDLTRKTEVEYHFNNIKPKYVIQAAAQVYGVGGFHRRPADILGRDTTLHTNILEASKLHNVERVVFISSSMVYEMCDGGEVLEGQEQYEAAPSTEYGLSKLVNERQSKAFWKQYLLPYTIWRPFNIITPHEIATSIEAGESHVFADFIRYIVEERRSKIPLIGDGHQVRCFTWIDDVAEAIAKWSFDEMTTNGVFNIGSTDAISMRQLAQMIEDAYSEIFEIEPRILDFETSVTYDDDVRFRKPNVDKAKIMLDWEVSRDTYKCVYDCVMGYLRSLDW